MVGATDSLQEGAASTMQIPPATSKPPTEGKPASSDQPVINLDLHQVDIDNEVFASKQQDPS